MANFEDEYQNFVKRAEVTVLITHYLNCEQYPQVLLRSKNVAFLLGNNASISEFDLKELNIVEFFSEFSLDLIAGVLENDIDPPVALETVFDSLSLSTTASGTDSPPATPVKKSSDVIPDLSFHSSERKAQNIAPGHLILPSSAVKGKRSLDITRQVHLIRSRPGYEMLVKLVKTSSLDVLYILKKLKMLQSDRVYLLFLKFCQQIRAEVKDTINLQRLNYVSQDDLIDKSSVL